MSKFDDYEKSQLKKHLKLSTFYFKNEKNISQILTRHAY
ncbi:hypothetical protein CNEO_430139 [Clostridium neonatale]|nr:hypothetical protein CNEO_430139 [Clostridium neonatale]